MGGIVKSAGGLLGLSSGPQAPGVESANGSLGDLQRQGNIYNDVFGAGTQNNLMQYGSGKETLEQAIAQAQQQYGGAGDYDTAFTNALATNPLTGSKYATEQVQNNPILGGLYGQGGQLSQAEGKLTDLQNQGFELQPEDRTLYGQESGDIARQFGQQGNQLANNLASRGLSASGAAGAAFSGLAGNQNEQLAKAQQQIAQQRFQNTLGQIGQYQNFVNSMGANAGNAINQQYQRQLAGVNQQTGQLEGAAGMQISQNAGANQANMSAFNANVENTPQNAFDTLTPAGMGKAASGLFGAAAKAAPVAGA